MMTQHNCKTWYKIATAVCVLVGVSMIATPLALAFSRDSDGMRIHAKPQALKTTQQDNLIPPKDRIDWRSFRIKKKQTVSILLKHKNLLKHKKKASTMELNLTQADGTSIQSTITIKGRATIKRVLEPGIYFFSLKSDRPVGYSITLK